jgi:hypothetical protein
MPSRVAVPYVHVDGASTITITRDRESNSVKIDIDDELMVITVTGDTELPTIETKDAE